jgi:hypothetical protein
MILVLTAIFALGCYKWGDWRNWKQYYPTMLFLIVGNLAYSHIFKNYMLWTYEGFINNTVASLISMFFLYPSVVILFLSRFPCRPLLKIAYVLTWSIVCTLLEYISLSLRWFAFYHGWNIFWSFGLYVIGFILLRLHQRHPLIVWPIGAALAAATMLLFRMPFGLLE